MNKSKLYVLAGGGHGRVILDALLSLKVQVNGLVDSSLVGSRVFDIPVLGDDEWLLKQNPSTTTLVNGLGITKNSIIGRKTLFEQFQNKGFDFLSICHPSAVVSQFTTIERGAQIMAGVHVQCGVFVGCNSVLNTCSSIDHDCIIAEHSFIGPNSTLCGQVRIEKNVLVGAGAVILPGITVGEGAIVAAGAVVTKNVLPDTCVYGNPASCKSTC